MRKEILGAVKTPQGEVSNDNMKGNINKDDNNKSEADDNREDPRDKNWGER